MYFILTASKLPDILFLLKYLLSPKVKELNSCYRVRMKLTLVTKRDQVILQETYAALHDERFRPTK